MDDTPSQVVGPRRSPSLKTQTTDEADLEPLMASTNSTIPDSSRSLGWNRTRLDHVFEWGTQYATPNRVARAHPIFTAVPDAYLVSTSYAPLSSAERSPQGRDSFF
ncbi:hypothetical protein BDZ85DRAFT_15748 [Elsinoe ampelina]|uniref:Uncharacterized protein n=1 Tax=Elsinoe ampelina TaxID=302913 RepID=A0A6A6G6C9_9PEZI|nr:hypothetical protein BDZ85DRAFT_15748 [Elsinoe ampelina]